MEKKAILRVPQGLDGKKGRLRGRRARLGKRGRLRGGHRVMMEKRGMMKKDAL